MASGPPRCAHGYIVPGSKWFKAEVDASSVDLEHDNEDEPTSGISAESIGKVPGLRIYLRKGRRLVARDDNGRSDPFVTFSITGERNSVKCKSSVINRTLNPIWNEEFFIAVKHLTGAKLTIEVRDKDRGLAGKVIKSDYMGSATISLNQHELMHFDDGEYNIPDLALRNERHQDALVDKTLGHVSLVISRSRDFGKFQGVPLPLEKSVLGKQYSNSQNMAIIIDIVRAKGLNPKEGQGILLDRVRDAYCTVKVGEDERKTRTIANSLAPEWTERFEYMAPGGIQHCQFAVWDNDLIKNELIGTVDLDLEAFPYEKSKEKWLDIIGMDQNSNIPVGELLVRVTVCNMMDQSVDLTLNDAWNDKIKMAPGLLTIKVIRARKLAAKDGIISKSSDPFVVVECGKTRLRTQTIQKSLDPEWNKTFTVPVNDVFQTLRITVYDEDDGGKKADFLGCLEFPLLWIPSSETALSQWFALKDDWLEGYAGGDINIFASFEYKNPQCLLALLNNREVDMMRKEPEFSPKLLSKYGTELKVLIMEIASIVIFCEGCFSAKHGFAGVVATVLVWAAITLYMHFWHFALFLSAALWYRLWLRAFVQKKQTIFAEATDIVESSGTDSDDDVEAGGYMSRIKKKVKKKRGGGGGGGLIKKWKSIMSILANAEESLGNVAQVLEKLKNLFLWKNFTASFSLSIILSVVSLAAYFLSGYLRQLVCVGGTFKILKEFRLKYYGLRKDEHMLNTTARKKMRSSYVEPTGVAEATLKKGNPIFNMISRVPSDYDIRQVGRFRPRIGEWKKQKMRDTHKAKAAK